MNRIGFALTNATGPGGRSIVTALIFALKRIIDNSSYYVGFHCHHCRAKRLCPPEGDGTVSHYPWCSVEIAKKALAVFHQFQQMQSALPDNLREPACFTLPAADATILQRMKERRTPNV